MGLRKTNVCGLKCVLLHRNRIHGLQKLPSVSILSFNLLQFVTESNLTMGLNIIGVLVKRFSRIAPWWMFNPTIKCLAYEKEHLCMVECNIFFASPSTWFLRRCSFHSSIYFNLLVYGRSGCDFKNAIFILFHWIVSVYVPMMKSSDECRGTLLASTDLGNGLVPPVNKPFPKPMLTRLYGVIGPQWVERASSEYNYETLFEHFNTF